jgi:hypothetical protein
MAYVAGEHAVGVEVPLNVPLIGVVNAKASVIEIPKITCAKPGQTPPGRAESAQVKLDATVEIPPSNSLITSLLTGLDKLLADLLGGLFDKEQQRVKADSLTTKVVISLTSAHSSAVLKSPGGIRCSSTGASGQGVSFDVTSSLADFSLSIVTGYTLQKRVKQGIFWGPWTDVVPPVNETLIGVTAGLGDATPYPADLNFPPPPSEEMPSHTRNTPLAVDLSLTTSRRNLVIALLGDLADPVLDKLLNPLLSKLNTDLLPNLDTALALLGVKLGNTTVKASGRPSCYPKLVG